MRILLTGGTGVLGRQVAEAAIGGGHTVRIGSRGGRPPGVPEEREWAAMDLATGAGLALAVAGVDVVVHAASDPRASRAVDVEGTRALVQAARAAGARHFLHVSIVGIDRIPLRYYQDKLHAERVVVGGGVPYSILRATQFHPFLDRLLRLAARVPLVMPLPSGFRVQPVDPREVAWRLLAAVDEGPRGRLPDFGGPETLTLAEAAREWRAARGEERVIVPVPLPGAAAAAIRAGAGTVVGGEHGTLRWSDWLAGWKARVPAVPRPAGQRSWA